MGSLDDLPADQRAVLQMVLQRSRSYDEIATLLSIERSAVRQRALDACESLTPDEIDPGPERSLVTDYLLGQLPQQVADQVYAYLEAASTDREWARAVAQALAPLSPKPMAEVPVGAPLRTDGPSVPDDGPAQAPDREQRQVGAEPEGEPEPDESYEWVEPAAVEPPQREAQPIYTWESEPAPEPEPAPARSLERASSAQRLAPAAAPAGGPRRGPIIGGVLALIVVVAVVVVALSGGSSPAHHAGGKKPPVTTNTGTASTPTQTTTTGTGTTGTTTTPQLLAVLNLTSPIGATQTLGVVQVIREQGVKGIVIQAQGVPPNSAHNAYAIWLYNSPTSAEFVGFIRNLVGKSGRFSAEGELPKDAASYKKILITLETQQSPKSPGQVVLSGPFREQP